MYNIDWLRFLLDRLWSPLRKVKMIAFLQALITPIKGLDTKFGLFRSEVKECVTITPQKRIMQYWLNQKFDPTNQSIEILDYVEVNTVFAYNESENETVFLPTFLSGNIYGFEVRLPISLQSDEPFIKAFLDKFKLAGKKYKLTYI